MKNLLKQTLIAGAIGITGLFSTSSHAAETDVTFINQQGVTLNAKLFTVDGVGARPAVILMHGCGGMYRNDASLSLGALFTEWSARLNEMGYHALVVDSFRSRGAAPSQCGDGSTGTSEVTDRPLDAAAAAAYLSGRANVDANKIGVVGWSHGGSSVMSTVATTGVFGINLIKTAVAFYPGCGLYSAFGGISRSTWYPNAPLVILAGKIDPLYTSGYCDTRVNRALAAASTAGVKNLGLSLIAYEGAKHSFDNARATSTAWTAEDVTAKAQADFKAVEFLRKYLGSF